MIDRALPKRYVLAAVGLLFVSAPSYADWGPWSPWTQLLGGTGQRTATCTFSDGTASHARTAQVTAFMRVDLGPVRCSDDGETCTRDTTYNVDATVKNISTAPGTTARIGLSASGGVFGSRSHEWNNVPINAVKELTRPGGVNGIYFPIKVTNPPLGSFPSWQARCHVR